MKNKCNGFTLAELMIVVTIIGVLVAVTIPVFSRQLEKSREATDLANVRAKYAEVKAEAMTATTAYPIKESVKLKQKQSDWQYYEPVVIAGIIHYKHDGNTDHWEGVNASSATLRRVKDSSLYGRVEPREILALEPALNLMRIFMKCLTRPDLRRSTSRRCLKSIPGVRNQ